MNVPAPFSNCRQQLLLYLFFRTEPRLHGIGITRAGNRWDIKALTSWVVFATSLGLRGHPPSHSRTKLEDSITPDYGVAIQVRKIPCSPCCLKNGRTVTLQGDAGAGRDMVVRVIYTECGPVSCIGDGTNRSEP
jgi:hypothetical protein